MKRGQNRSFSLCNSSPKNHKGQINLSFGMIFSIILIIVFLAFGFYAIKKFIDMQNTIQVETFLNNLQSDIDNMWKSPQGSQTLKYNLPSKISQVCFVDDDLQNLEFTASEILKGDLIEHLDIATITAKENPFCINNVKGKISMTIVKDFGETLVRVVK